MPRTTALKESTPPRSLYERHRPEQTLLYRIIDRHYPRFLTYMSEQGKPLPCHVPKEFDEFLKCGRLEHGFLRVQCSTCHKERLVAFSCKRRGFCPSCGARRMTESAALLVDEVLPHEPVRQWVLSIPYQLRFLFASRPELMGKVLGIVYRAIATYLIKKAGQTPKTAKTGAVTLIQRFGRSGAPGALNLNPNAARSTSTCCSWMEFMQKINTKKKYFNRQMRRLRKHLPNLYTRSVTA